MTVVWSARTSQHFRSGSAATRSNAWESALESALALAAETDGKEVLELGVAEESAHLYPAADVDDRYDPTATRELADQVLDVLVGSPGEDAGRR